MMGRVAMMRYTNPNSRPRASRLPTKMPLKRFQNQAVFVVAQIVNLGMVWQRYGFHKLNLQDKFQDPRLQDSNKFQGLNFKT